MWCDLVKQCVQHFFVNQYFLKLQKCVVLYETCFDVPDKTLCISLRLKNRHKKSNKKFSKKKNKTDVRVFKRIVCESWRWKLFIMGSWKCSEKRNITNWHYGKFVYIYIHILCVYVCPVCMYLCVCVRVAVIHWSKSLSVQRKKFTSLLVVMVFP